MATKILGHLAYPFKSNNETTIIRGRNGDE